MLLIKNMVYFLNILGFLSIRLKKSMLFLVEDIAFLNFL